MDRNRPATRLDISFPTGNGLVVACVNGVVLDRDLRGSTGDRWYWHVRLRATKDTELRVRLARPDLIGQFGPAVRTASTYDWLWSTPGPDTGFDLHAAGGTTVYASATIPYGPRDLSTFLERLQDVLRWEVMTDRKSVV